MKVFSNPKTMTIVIIAIACLIAHINAESAASGIEIEKLTIHDIEDWDQKHSLLGTDQIIPDDHSQIKNIFSADNYTLFDVMYIKSVHSPVCEANDQDCLVNLLKF